MNDVSSSKITPEEAKYQNLAVEIKRIWRLEKVNITVSVEGVVSTDLALHLSRFYLQKDLIPYVQKAALLQTCR